MQDFKLQPIHAAGAGAALIALVLAISALTGPSTPTTVSAPDFRQYEAGPERKAAFFNYMLPIVEARNAVLRERRERLLSIQENPQPGGRDRRFVEQLAGEYKIALATDSGEPRPFEQVVEELLLHVDEVPVSLALAQAAKESGWGTSRFAREGNNFFGEWCFSPGCGIVPASRAPGKIHEVEAFDSPAESVASYTRNINTHNGYKSFREARKRQRSRDDALSGVELAGELSRYSERGAAYVTELRQLIVGNDLDALDDEEVGVN